MKGLRSVYPIFCKESMDSTGLVQFRCIIWQSVVRHDSRSVYIVNGNCRAASDRFARKKTIDWDKEGGDERMGWMDGRKAINSRIRMDSNTTTPGRPRSRWIKEKGNKERSSWWRKSKT